MLKIHVDSLLYIDHSRIIQLFNQFSETDSAKMPPAVTYSYKIHHGPQSRQSSPIQSLLEAADLA